MLVGMTTREFDKKHNGAKSKLDYVSANLTFLKGEQNKSIHCQTKELNKTT